MEPNEHDKMKENCEMNRTTGVEKQAVENSLLGHKDRVQTLQINFQL